MLPIQAATLPQAACVTTTNKKNLPSILLVLLRCRVAPLYQHVFPPACPTLALIGLPWKVCKRSCARPPRSTLLVWSAACLVIEGAAGAEQARARAPGGALPAA